MREVIALETTASARAKWREEAERDFLADKAGTLVASWFLRDLIDDLDHLLAKLAEAEAR